MGCGIGHMRREKGKRKTILEKFDATSLPAVNMIGRGNWGREQVIFPFLQTPFSQQQVQGVRVIHNEVHETGVCTRRRYRVKSKNFWSPGGGIYRMDPARNYFQISKSGARDFIFYYRENIGIHFLSNCSVPVGSCLLSQSWADRYL